MGVIESLRAVLRARRRRSDEVAYIASLGHENAVVAARQTATLEAPIPRRAFIGVGSGEAMNEVPTRPGRPAPGRPVASA